MSLATSSPHFIEMLNGDTFAWGNVALSSLNRKAFLYDSSTDDKALHLFQSRIPNMPIQQLSFYGYSKKLEYTGHVGFPFQISDVAHLES